MTDDQKLLNYLKAVMSQDKRNSGYWQTPDFVPFKVRMLRTVRADYPQLIGEKLSVGAGHEYEVVSNKWGAVCAKVGGRSLGLIPHEFEVIEWIENPHKAQAALDAAGGK